MDSLALLWSYNICRTCYRKVLIFIIYCSSEDLTTYTVGCYRSTTDVSDITSKYLIVTRPVVVHFQKMFRK
jgi:hypothetical protein